MAGSSSVVSLWAPFRLERFVEYHYLVDSGNSLRFSSRPLLEGEASRFVPVGGDGKIELEDYGEDDRTSLTWREGREEPALDRGSLRISPTSADKSRAS